jgi:hypothetical protein
LPQCVLCRGKVKPGNASCPLSDATAEISSRGIELPRAKKR